MHYTGLKTRALFSGAFSPSAPLSPVYDRNVMSEPSFEEDGSPGVVTL
jgi:hypothetical protein